MSQCVCVCAELIVVDRVREGYKREERKRERERWRKEETATNRCMLCRLCARVCLCVPFVEEVKNFFWPTMAVRGSNVNDRMREVKRGER